MNHDHLRSYFDDLNHEYLAVHRRKEELFWATYMGISQDHEGFAAAEKAWKSFIADPQRLATVRRARAELEANAGDTGDTDDGAAAQEGAELLAGLRGWQALFETNVIETKAGLEAMERIVTLEARLFEKRQKLVLRHRGEGGKEEDASLGMLLVNEAANPDEGARKSSHDALRFLETWVLERDFLEIVKARNAFAETQGYRSYFDYKVAKSEAMTSEELFAILDEFETRTAASNRRGLELLGREHGTDALLPWNLKYHMSGDLTRESDPYFPFARSLERWVDSFRRLGIGYRGAVMQLDLLERAGKYQNGFCHGPVPAFYDHGSWTPARVNFTSGAKPDQVGSGRRAIATLFHEGGHAAHFANVTGNAPCFSQEFPPTSAAYAETQSLFCESLLDDGDWLIRHARDEEGRPMPLDLIRRLVERGQPFRSFNERMILVVPYFERELYRLAEDELVPERVLELARRTERRILGVESHRPLLAIPHLLNQESAASFHGYLLANMAVFQTRAWLVRELGYLADNPAVGPLLAEHYWAAGNGQTHDEGLRSLTGEGFSARYLAEVCNQSPEEARARAEASIEAAARRSYPTDYPAELGAKLRIVHGEDLIADNSVSEERMCRDFAAYVAANYPTKPTANRQQGS